MLFIGSSRFRYLDLEKIVNKLRRRPGGSTWGSSFIWGDLTITGHKATSICGQDLFLKSVTNCTDCKYLSKHGNISREKSLFNFQIAWLWYVIYWRRFAVTWQARVLIDMVGPAFSQSSNNAGKFAFLVSLVSSDCASHCKENNINYSNNLLLVRIKNTPCFYFEKKKKKKRELHTSILLT